MDVKLAKIYEPVEVEGKIYQLWQKSGFLIRTNCPKRTKGPIRL